MGALIATATILASLTAAPGMAPAGDDRPQPGTIALTFDDGPHPHWTPLLLDVLAAHDATATFFVLGRWVDAHPELAREILTRGHSLQSHTYHHYALTALGPAALRREFLDTNRAIRAATGTRPTCFRPPFGRIDRRVRLAAAAAGLTPVMWTQDTQDYAFRSPTRLTDRAGEWMPGDVVLAHEVWAGQWIEALPTILESLQARGIGLSAICRNVPVGTPRSAAA